MLPCPHCGSESVYRKGHTLKGGAIQQRYLCRKCSKPFYDKALPPKTNPPKAVKKKSSKPERTWVITSAVNDVPLNRHLFTTLQSYAKLRNATLVIVPVKYQQYRAEDGSYNWPAEIHPYFETGNIRLTTGLRLLAGVRVSPAIGNPLTGFECFSKGDSIILAHGQLMMKTIAMSHVDPSAIMTTTGSITQPIYTSTKQGSKAADNHSYSALVIEEDHEINGFHIRSLNSDESGSFYDLDRYYDGDTISFNTDIPAIVLGDEHIIHADPAVTAATFTNPDSIVNTLRPKRIVRHDSLDFYSANHHHAKNPFIQYAKYVSGKNDSAKELSDAIQYIQDTTPDFAESIVVSSNHNEHLNRWLSEVNIKTEPWNALLFHELTFLILKNIMMTESGASIPNAFESWARHNYKLDNVKFVSNVESFKICGVELSFHGDRGANGSRGSAAGFSKLGNKCVIGHSHCLVDGHSALTKTGWKPIHEVVEGELVLAFDYVTNSNIWVKNKKTHIFNYSGYIIDIKNTYFRQSITENHNLFTKSGEYINACQAILTRSPNEIPLTSNGILDDNGIEMPDLTLRQIVAVCADGCFYDRSLSFHVKKDRKINRLLELFNGDLTMRGVVKNGAGSYKLTIRMDSESYRNVTRFVPPFTGEKRLPEIFRDLNRRCKKIVLDELSHRDGTFINEEFHGGRQFSTAKKTEADLVSSLCVELGYRTTMNPREIRAPRNYVLWVVSWCENRNKIWSTELNLHVKGLFSPWKASSRSVTNKRVSCLTTDVNNFWVKHAASGLVSLTGNSPQIFGGAYQVGHSCYGNLDYNIGPSSWAKAHVAIQPNGKRQMIFIISGKWRR